MAKRVTSIGGQALLEGILMVGPKKNVAAFCDEAGNITTEEVSTPSLREIPHFEKAVYTRRVLYGGYPAPRYEGADAFGG